MRAKWFCTLLVILSVGTQAQQFTPALPGYHFEFPRDHFNHPDYQTEWWYYTGNVKTNDGRRFGFELTFFRQGISRAPHTSAWSVQDVYMAHLALSDVNGSRYLQSERLNRAGPGIAGIDAATGLVWNGNWQSKIGPISHHLRGIAENFAIDLDAQPEKPPVVNGLNGVSQKAEGTGHASHYASITRMKASGELKIDGTSYRVDGDAWMDHEFFSESLNGEEVGWDWLSVQLEDKTELMLYRLRHKDGSVDPYSSGTFVDSSGKPTHLALSDFTMDSKGDVFTSTVTSGKYPTEWAVTVPQFHLQINISTPLKNQEFVSRFGPSYWEGAIDVTGKRAAQTIRGTGYLEMTGYAGTAKSHE